MGYLWDLYFSRIHNYIESNKWDANLLPQWKAPFPPLRREEVKAMKINRLLITFLLYGCAAAPPYDAGHDISYDAGYDIPYDSGYEVPYDPYYITPYNSNAGYDPPYDSGGIVPHKVGESGGR
jgi:hypothetical protein